jgi:preprotein translocase subunit SecB
MSQKQMIEHPPFEMNIVRVIDLAFSVNEKIFKLNAQIEVSFTHRTSWSVENNMFLIDLNSTIHYKDDTTKTPIISLTVQNIFSVKNLQDFISEKGEPQIPIDALVTMVSLSVSHSRALMAKNCAGTLYQGIMLPLINPLEMTQSFYKNRFEKISAVIEE